MAELSELALSEALDVLIDYRGKSPPKSITGIPVISAKVVKGGRVTFPVEQTIDPAYYPAWMTRGLPKVGDVVMTTEGPMGEVAQLDKETAGFALGQRVVCMRGKPGVLDNTFFKFLLMSPGQQAILHSYATGTTVAGISQKALRSVPIRLPPFDDQVAIGRLLGALDDKIAVNRRMNETLEAMARAIFDHSMSAEAWVMQRLGAHCEIYDGPHATPKLVEDGPIFLGISNLSAGTLDLTNTKHLSEADFAQWTRRVQPQRGDIVFSYETRLGEVALIPGDLRCCLGRRMGLLRVKRETSSPEIVLQAFLGAEFQETIRRRTIHGSTVDRIPLGELGDFPIRLPASEEVEGLAQRLELLRSKIECNQREVQTLNELRDLLLPKLMSGEFRVRDAENIVEAAA